MRSSEDIEDVIREANCAGSDAMRRRLWQNVADRRHQAVASGRGSLLRTIIKSNLTKLAAAAMILVVAFILWQTFSASSKAYALSDALGIIGRAKTIHMRTVRGDKTTWEHWCDIETGREHLHHEGVYHKAWNSPETYRESITAVRDEQYVMTVDHEKRTVRFERLLSWERELYRLRMADFAMSAVFPDVLRHLNQYTKMGRDKMDGQPYDIWRRQWRDTKLDLQIRYDIWLSPSSGEIGRTRQWVLYSFEGKVDWVLSSETGKIEIDQEPPAGTFATTPPDGYVPENSKATADILRTDFLLRRNWQQGYELYALPGFTLEDGSIVAIWTVTNGPARPDPNDAYKGLTLGGPLPQTPIALPGLMLAPAERRYGSVSDWDESTPFTLINAVGRHLMATRKANRVYEWALYVPQEVISSQEPRKEIITVIKLNIPDQGGSSMGISSLNSLAVTPTPLAHYLSDAFRELSEDQGVPAFMEYGSLLNLAAHVRNKQGLYEDFAKEVRELKERTIGSPEPVQVTPADGVK